MALLNRARARLRRRGGLVLFVLLLGASGCATTAPLGYVDVYVYDCGAGEQACTSAEAGGEHVAAQAYVDPSASRYAPQGLYTYFELPRADGTTGVLELDVPTRENSGNAVQRYQASYRELAGEEARFESSSASGEVRISSLLSGGPSCGCDDGAFALRFVDPGQDHTRGTRDDRARLLAFGRLGWSKDFCRAPSEASVPDGLRVVSESCVGPSSAAAPPTDSGAQPAATTSDTTTVTNVCVFDCYQGAQVVQAQPAYASGAPSAGGGCDSSGSDSGNDGCGSGSSSDSSGCGDTSSSSDSGGCGGSGSSSGGGACEGDTTDSSSSNGCGGDSSSSSSSNDGCGGDSSNSSDDRSSCAVVRAARTSSSRTRRGSRRSHAFSGTGLPLALTCLLLSLRATRLRAAKPASPFVPPRASDKLDV